MPQSAIDYPTSAPGLEVNAVADGYIVYQQDRDRIHYLNHTAAVVFELCNGRNTARDLPELVRLAFDLPEPPTEAVASCLEMLGQEGLVL
jgi:hypothetical protein